MRGQGNSRRQLLDCLAHGFVEIFQSLPIESPVEDGTDVGAGQPEFDVIHLIDHRVLGVSRSAVGRQRTRRKLTLIIERIMLTEPKTALAGVMLESSLARFKTSMDPFKAEIALSRPFGRRDSISMVETRGGRERAVRRGGVKKVSDPNRAGRQFCHDTPRGKGREKLYSRL